ncbi:hypothetical protein CORC01_06427 [Colletotrichum orchidophilum]|uniref:Uncharacterized protein n=1 Tax=Colletotrichum orchidophilum TaxID=1209926 RepID=A0A1G4B9Z3_9PEZI|nr:uncharacterized protein CORC01_06427 [Colletotrichum orchidophilum]OHE98230.1 hypothetical protein CORC01_06427 [Colletotrichum orchidophilum]
MRFSSFISAAALFVSAQAVGPCDEIPVANVTGDAITGFIFSTPSCNDWIWQSRDKGTNTTLKADCFMRQSWPNPSPVTTVCIRDKNGDENDKNKCFKAPTEADQGICQLSGDWCTSVENMWGW